MRPGAGGTPYSRSQRVTERDAGVAQVGGEAAGRTLRRAGPGSGRTRPSPAPVEAPRYGPPERPPGVRDFRVK